jgi:hypothetical protein
MLVDESWLFRCRDIVCLAVAAPLTDKHEVSLVKCSIVLGALESQSGAPGPLLFDLRQVDSVKLFEKELLARAPWRENTRLPTTEVAKAAMIVRLAEQRMVAWNQKEDLIYPQCMWTIDC